MNVNNKNKKVCKPCNLKFESPHEYEAHIMDRHFQFNKGINEKGKMRSKREKNLENKETAFVRRLVYKYSDVLKVGYLIYIKDIDALPSIKKRPRKEHITSPLGVTHSWRFNNVRSYTR
jgi:hypothetical protein